MRCDAITGAVRVKGWSHSLAYRDKHLTSPKTLYTIKLPAKENWENDHQWNFIFCIDSIRKGNIYPKIEGRLSKSAAIFPNLNFGLLPPWGFVTLVNHNSEVSKKVSFALKVVTTIAIKYTVEPPLTATSLQRPSFLSWWTAHKFTLILTSLQRPPLHNGNASRYQNNLFTPPS